MLILTREPSERIYLNPGTPEQITICIVRIAGQRVQVGIDAPQGVLVVREEVLGKEKRGVGASVNTEKATTKKEGGR